MKDINEQNSDKFFNDSSQDYLPLVSVLIPLYNHEKYILDCLNSIIDQNYPNLEIVLVDDASRDNGLNIANDRLKTTNLNYTIHKNTFNQGICATLNRAVSSAKGKYVCLIASDDLLAEGRIKNHVSILEKCIDSSIIACHGPIHLFENNNSELIIKKTLHKKNNYSLTSVLLKTSKLNLQGCTFFNKKLINYPFDENLYFEDWDFFIRLFLNNHKIIYDDKTTAYYRKQTSGANRNVIKMIDSRNKIRDKYFQTIALKDQKLANLFDFTIRYWNLIGMSYQGHKFLWCYELLKLSIKNPIQLSRKFKDTAWAFKNLLTSKKTFFSKH